MEASVEERARRRFDEICARGEHSCYEQVLESMKRRDNIDRHRKHAPLRPAEDAVKVDTDGVEIDDVVDQILALVNARILFRQNVAPTD
jgi:cytidylate kinase